MHNHISTKRDGCLQCGGAKTIVNRQHSIGSMCNVCQRTDVTDFSQGIGRCFGKQQTSVWLNGLLPFRHVGLRHKRGLHTKLGEFAAQQFVCRAKHRVRAHHMVAILEQRHAQEQDGCHAAGCSHACLRTLKRSQSLFKTGHRGVGKA